MSVTDKRAALQLFHFKKKKTDTSKYSIKNLFSQIDNKDIPSKKLQKPEKNYFHNQSLHIGDLSMGSSSKNVFTIKTIRKSNPNITVGMKD